MLRLLVTSLLISLCNFASARILFLTEDNVHQDLTNYIEYYEDPTNNFSIDDISTIPSDKWRLNDQPAFNHGYSRSTWWLKLTASNRNSEAITRFLEIAYPVLDHIDIYIFKQDQQQLAYRLGDKIPYHERPVDHRNFIAPITWQQNEKLTIYLSLRSSSSIQAPLTLWEERNFFSRDRTTTMMQGIYYGIMIVMILYNLFVYLAVGERNYLYYVFYVSFMTLFVASLSGFTFEFFWPSYTLWNDQAILVSLSGAVLFGSLFSIKFLDGKILSGLTTYGGYTLIMLSFLTAVLAILLPYSIVITLLIPLAGFACIAGVCFGLFHWFSGGLSARYYTVAWSSLLVGGLVLALNKFDILPKIFFTEHAAQIGSAIEVILLSFALAERINQERKMRFDAQKDALQTERQLRQAREEALAIQRRATESLEQRVTERTMELENLNRQLARLSDTDQLTGLKNRRFLDRILSEEFARCSRYSHPISVLLIDIDHFKKLNDVYGHLIGDECLKNVAICVQNGLRWPTDRPTRYGGEEFCVVLPETETKGATAVAERIRYNVENMNFKVKEKIVHVTVSVGIASYVPNEHDTVEQIVMRADEALYQSKQNGRNKVTLYT